MTIYRLCNTCDRTYPMAGRSTGKCPDCMRAYERDKSRRRRTTSPAARTRDTAAWQHARAQARARDGGCIHRATGTCNGNLSVHHILPLEQGGTNELANLVTLCRRHHEEAEAGFFRGDPHTRQIADRERKSEGGPSIG